ncbi:AraC family transcriptional regulator [Roseibium marinum]|nr:AraC family transcriptional regulator [Roseibium marinum]
MPKRTPEDIVDRQAPAILSGTDGTGKSASENGVFQSAVIEDPAVQALLQPWVEMECHQLSHGGTVARLDSLDLGTHQVVRERQETSIHKLGATPPDFCTLSFCMKARRSRFAEHCAEEGETIFFMPGNVEFDVFVPAGGETAYVGFSQEQFLQGARILNPGFWEKPPKGVVPLTACRRSELKSAVDLWLRTAREAAGRGAPLDPDVVRGHLLQTVLQIATVTEEDIAPTINERLRALQIGRTARSFVDESLDTGELPTLVGICAALGVSERTLRYAFREYVGLSPVAYLRARRLSRVRAVLAASDPQDVTITQVAMRYGFLHLGRFAGDYRLMFGEMPSMTLAS